MKRVLFAAPGHEHLFELLTSRLGWECGEIETRRFPDGETYLRILTPVAHAECAILSGLDRPDDKILPLIFLADAARDLGAARVGLIAPYLAYMRQDTRFKPGEAVTSRSFATLVSSWFQWLVTVDPHLHRRRTLSEIYSIPCETLHAAPAVAAWIRASVERPLLVGPDEESEQWVSEVAARVGAPHAVLRKERLGDREVRISIPDLSRWRDRTPVLVDDIVSTGRTMIETVRQLVAARTLAPVCVCVHGIFAQSAYADLIAAGAARVVTSNTIPHPTNAIDLSELIADGVRSVSSEKEK